MFPHSDSSRSPLSLHIFQVREGVRLQGSTSWHDEQHGVAHVVFMLVCYMAGSLIYDSRVINEAVLVSVWGTCSREWIRCRPTITTLPCCSGCQIRWAHEVRSKKTLRSVFCCAAPLVLFFCCTADGKGRGQWDCTCTNCMCCCCSRGLSDTLHGLTQFPGA